LATCGINGQKEAFMRGVVTTMSAVLWLSVSAGSVWAQAPPGTPEASLVGKSTNAIGYVVGGGSTKVDLKATGAVPQASGEAKVEARQGITNIEVKVKGLVQPTKLGTEFLTYVLWVVTAEGRTGNSGELLIDKSGEGELKTTTPAQTFSLLVTAEPYFAVRQPSEVVVLENELRKDTKGRIFPISDYKLMRRAQYQKMGNPLALSLDLEKVPLDMYEARNAVEIARSRGAEKYAPEIFTKADGGLKLAESALARKANKREIISTARTTVQSAEDARALAVQRQDEERIAAEREAAAAKAKATAEAKAATEAAAAKQKADADAAAAKQRADEEAKRQAELSAAREAQMKAEADAAAVKAKAEADALKAKADADAAQAKAEADALKAKEEAAKADAERARQATEQLRAQLLEQLNRVLETRDTPRGLVVTMADVLFDTGKYDLRQEAREKLARLSGIILAHPGLKLEVEGHTDSTGSDDLNQKLSEQRASAVRSYLMEQGLSGDNVTARGFGKTMPVADNGTAAGRQKNRRVEMIVSGEAIGTKIGK
jgi:outer membrane protein OmpA-like peptidoglycan-associated protein